MPHLAPLTEGKDYNRRLSYSMRALHYYKVDACLGDTPYYLGNLRSPTVT